MPRSGTTLVEQILSNHSKIYGAGELNILNMIVDINTTDTKNRLVDLFNLYNDHLVELETSHPYVVDKMPLNFRWIGYILSAMPEAKVIHVKRDPMAVCWSLFKTYFASKGIGFSNDLNDIILYYKLYLDLMDFWNRKFPNVIYELNYDLLINNQRQETAALIDYIGVNWEEECVNFHENRRAVRTASSGQVRQKIYRGSSQKWRNYEKYLEEVQKHLN